TQYRHKRTLKIFKVQDDEVGDGTTSVTVLAAELLREAELLIAKKIHPQTIISESGDKQVSFLPDSSFKTALRLSAFKNATVNTKQPKGGSAESLNVYLWFVFRQIFGSRVRVDSTAKVAEIELAEKEKMKEKVDRILKHGINCFINRQLIYNYPEQLFSQAGVMAIEHADFAGVERLALVTGGEITSTFDHPELVKLGHCKLIEEVMIGEDTLIHFSGVAMGEACTVVLRGATQQILDEAERSLHDALCVLAQTVKEPRTVYGGGKNEMPFINKRLMKIVFSSFSL
uniref:Chaperonin containing TCP1 subunit 2 n=1 Tax=Acanthochromis polyacanthus TaxID=80966 RepID=A0A3Q1GA57_9TELE